MADSRLARIAERVNPRKSSSLTVLRTSGFRQTRQCGSNGQRQLDLLRIWARCRRTHRNGDALLASDDELDALIGFVAAQTNYEPNRATSLSNRDT